MAKKSKYSASSKKRKKENLEEQESIEELKDKIQRQKDALNKIIKKYSKK